jgi:hypothetical protein
VEQYARDVKSASLPVLFSGGSARSDSLIRGPVSGVHGRNRFGPGDVRTGAEGPRETQNVDSLSASGVFYRGKIETDRFFCRQTLTNVFSRQAALYQEDTSALDMPEAAF